MLHVWYSFILSIYEKIARWIWYKNSPTDFDFPNISRAHILREIVSYFSGKSLSIHYTQQWSLVRTNSGLVKKEKSQSNNDVLTVTKWRTYTDTILKLKQEASLNVATQQNETGEPMLCLINNKLVSSLYEIIQTRNMLMDRSYVPWDRWIQKTHGGQLCRIKTAFATKIYSIRCHHVLLWVLSPRKLQCPPHQPGHHQLLPWSVLSIWSLPA